MTQIPLPTLTDTGYVVPLETEILEGVQADINAALGGDIDQSLTTPQGQLAVSQTAIIADRNEQFLALLNAIDPSYSSGRWQDGIGRIYFLTRIPAQSTIVTATLTGRVGTVIPAGAQAKAQDGSLYYSLESVTIPSTGYIDCSFSCAETGPIACPSGHLDTIYKDIPGWDSITNGSAGTVGRNVETAAEFEVRRKNSVAGNSVGFLTSILSSVLSVYGVIDAYTSQNNESYTTGAVFVGEMSGTTLTVTTLTSGTIAIGQTVTGAGIATGTIITEEGSGTGAEGTYVVSISQTVASSSMASAVGGVPLLANSIYVAVSGGTSEDIAEAIFLKKTPCAMTGNTTVTVYDTYSGYSVPYPSYPITFQRPTAVPIKMLVTMQTSLTAPPDAADLIRAAIIDAFNGVDGGTRARIGSYVFSSRYYLPVASIGSWALIYSILIGVDTADQTSLLMQIDQIPTLDESDIEVVFG